MDRVFVCYKDQGYGNFSEPLAVFSTQENAEIYLAGFNASYDSGMLIKEMEIW